MDDNQDGADSLAMVLKMMGNDARTAYDGKEGVELAEEFRPEVVLLFDIGMPKLNEYEACRLIRKQPWGRRIIVIAVTGWGQDDAASGATTPGSITTWSSPWIRKP